MTHSRWQLAPSYNGQSFIQGDGSSPLLTQLLYNRGITEASQAETFLAADERLTHDPYLLPDMGKAVSRTYQALLRGEKIAVYGDFDADGITASAITVGGLKALGGDPVLYIPHRLNEGHGLHASALEQLRRDGVSLVITVDCGVTGYEEVAQAQKAGQDIIVTDHHRLTVETGSPGVIGKPLLPPALAVVNPHRPGSAYPFAELAGVGVAYKFLQALMGGMGRGKETEQYLDLVALGTVADMVILQGDNRYMVRRGLEIINKHCERPGLKELLRQAGLAPGNVDAEGISYNLSPRLNAAGRIDHAMLSYRLLTSSSDEEIQELACRLEQCNDERQKLTTEIFSKAKEIARAQGEDTPIIIVEGENFWSGVTGIVAGRLVQEFSRPAIVVEWGPETCRGSARSIAEFDIIAALQGCAGMLEKFGGHPQAAGFSVPTNLMPELRKRLTDMARQKLEGVDLRPQLLIDMELPLGVLDGQVYPQLQKLAPFGKGNPTPTFLSRNTQVVDCRRVGKQGEHLRLKLKAPISGGQIWQAVGFDLGHLTDETAPTSIDVAYQLGVDNWQGRSRLELRVVDFVPFMG